MPFFFARIGQADLQPSASIRSVKLTGSNDRTIGVEFLCSQRKLTLGRIDPNGLAGKSGLHTGDTVIAVNGKSLAALEGPEELPKATFSMFAGQATLSV